MKSPLYYIRLYIAAQKEMYATEEREGRRLSLEERKVIAMQTRLKREKS